MMQVRYLGVELTSGLSCFVQIANVWVVLTIDTHFNRRLSVSILRRWAVDRMKYFFECKLWDVFYRTVLTTVRPTRPSAEFYKG